MTRAPTYSDFASRNQHGITVPAPHGPSRKPRYRTERVPLPDGTTHGVPAQREKETDLRIGLDMVRIARNGALDVAVTFSQDQNLAEVAQEVHTNRIDLQCQISTKTRSLLYPDIKPKPGGEQLLLTDPKAIRLII